LRTAMQELIYLAAKFCQRSNQLRLRFSAHCAPPLMKADPLVLSEADPLSARVDVGEARRWRGWLLERREVSR
jgi:hypothetical protein